MPELRSQRYADTPAPDDTNTSNNVNVDTGVVGSGNPVRIDPAQGQTEGALREENPLGRGDQEMPGPRDSSDHPGVTVIHGTPKDAVTYIAPEKQEFFAPPPRRTGQPCTMLVKPIGSTRLQPSGLSDTSGRLIFKETK